MKKTITLEDPGEDEALELIKQGIERNRFIDIFGKCEIDYEGRASSYIGLGDRVVIMKPDGTLLVHRDKKREPVNWQPPGCIHTADLHENNLRVISTRRDPNEVLEIVFDKVYLVSSLEVEDTRRLELVGNEESMRKQILANPEKVEEGFKPFKDEAKSGFGYIDIYGTDKKGNTVIVELKARRSGPDAVDQLKRYVEEYSDHLEEDQNIRGILIAPSLTDSAERRIDEEGFEFISLEAENKQSTKRTSLDEF